MVKKIIGFLFVFLLLITMVSAAPPQAQAGDGQKCSIAYPPYGYVKTNTNFSLHVHVFDTIQGLQQTNSTISCVIELFDVDGSHLLDKTPLSPEPDGDFQIDIAGGNFTIPGIYSFLIYCNGTVLDTFINPDDVYDAGCFINGAYEVNNIGVEFTDAISRGYVNVVWGLFLLFGLCLFTFYNLPKDDPKDLDGKLMDISYMKYLRLPVLGLGWGALTTAFYLGWNISEGYFSTFLVANIFKMLFTFNMIFISIFVPLAAVYIIAKIVQDQKFKNMLERGLM